MLDIARWIDESSDARGRRQGKVGRVSEALINELQDVRSSSP
jgi:hypothetical protein